MKTLLLSLLITAVPMLLQAAPAKELPVVKLYSYHQAPPFHVDGLKKVGLNFDFVAALQKQLKDIMVLEHHSIARPKLNALLKKGKPALVLWGSPLWFQFDGLSFLWSMPIFNDEDVLATLSENAYKGHWRDSLRGKKLGGRAGYRYTGIDEAVESGLFERVDAPNDLINIERLLVGQVDAILIVKSSLLYYARTMELINTIKIVGEPHSSYNRQLLLTHHHKDYLPRINQAIDNIMKNQELKQRLYLYGVKEL